MWKNKFSSPRSVLYLAALSYMYQFSSTISPPNPLEGFKRGKEISLTHLLLWESESQKMIHINTVNLSIVWVCKVWLEENAVTVQDDNPKRQLPDCFRLILFTSHCIKITPLPFGANSSFSPERDAVTYCVLGWPWQNDFIFWQLSSNIIGYFSTQ